MTVYLESRGWHPGLNNGGVAATDADTVATIRRYWSAGEKPSAIATKCGVSHSTVIRYTKDLPAQQQKDRLTAAETADLLRGW